MEPNQSSKPSLGSLARRRAVSASGDELAKLEPMRQEGVLPLLVTPTLPGVSLGAWLEGHRARVEEKLLEHGGILFRGFGINTPEALQELVKICSGSLLEYTYRSTPRSQVKGDIYTSTEYPADEWIPMHNEMSYTRRWPMRLWFCCAKAAERGGETPLADSRRVYQALDPALRERFERQGVMYVRNYGDGLDLSWANVFQTDNKDEVEAFCRANGIRYEWKDGNRLRTVQVCQGTARHPRTGDAVWFNQAHLFHVSSLKPEVQEQLRAMLREDELPRNTYYGDGSAIEPEVLAAIREVFTRESVLFPWQDGDAVLLDNMLAAHGRAPFGGPRKILVGMAEAQDSDWHDAA